jgi:hypothetical protein
MPEKEGGFMMRRTQFLAIIAAATVAGGALAQGMPSAAPAVPLDRPEMRVDESFNELNRLRDNANWGFAGLPKTSRPVPASPKDVTPGSEVRDSRGVVLGKVDSVDAGFAVVESPGGRVEVEVASFAKNNKGLLINMRKAKFDAIVAGGK